MVAVEGGKGTPTGVPYDELPDRVADSLFLVALGYAAALPWLGWLGALLAALTACIRALGGALGQPQDFRGPMAKPHRMWPWPGRPSSPHGCRPGGCRSCRARRG